MRHWRIFGFFVLLCVIGAGCGRKTETPPKTAGQTAQSQPEKSPPKAEPSSTQPVFSSKSVPERSTPGIGETFVVHFCSSLYHENKTSQQRLNSFLKILDTEGKQYEDTGIRGDIFNLRGRFYYYKIFLDREEKLFEGHLLFEENWKQIWQEEAVKAFEAAKAAYVSAGARTVLNLPVKPWMPEGQEQQHRFIKYPDVGRAASEMDEWIGRARECKY